MTGGDGTIGVALHGDGTAAARRGERGTPSRLQCGSGRHGAVDGDGEAHGQIGSCQLSICVPLSCRRRRRLCLAFAQLVQLGAAEGAQADVVPSGEEYLSVGQRRRRILVSRRVQAPDGRENPRPRGV